MKIDGKIPIPSGRISTFVPYLQLTGNGMESFRNETENGSELTGNGTGYSHIPRVLHLVFELYGMGQITKPTKY